MTRILNIFFKKITRSTNQNVWFVFNFIESINNSIIESKEKLVSTSLTTIKLFDKHEIFEIFVIDDHFDETWKVFKLKTSFFKDTNDDHKFFVINFVIALDEIMFLREIRDWMQYVVLVILWQNVFKHIIQNVDFDHKFKIWIVVTQYNIENESFFQNDERFFAFRKSNKDNVFSR